MSTAEAAHSCDGMRTMSHERKLWLVAFVSVAVELAAWYALRTMSRRCSIALSG